MVLPVFSYAAWSFVLLFVYVCVINLLNQFNEYHIASGTYLYSQ